MDNHAPSTARALLNQFARGEIDAAPLWANSVTSEVLADGTTEVLTYADGSTLTVPEDEAAVATP